jgi:endonuclease/exonuclease/phosphatase (EEP) superfamily protein YafD
VLGQGRAAVGAVVVVAGRRIQAWSLHLGSPFGASPGQRRDQLQVVLCRVKEDALPAVVAGDFNSWKLGNRLVADGYSWPTRTIGASTHGQSFDHVFVKGLPVVLLGAGVARDVDDASDHRPVFVDLGTEGESPSSSLKGMAPARDQADVRGLERGEDHSHLAEPAQHGQSQ